VDDSATAIEIVRLDLKFVDVLDDSLSSIEVLSFADPESVEVLDESMAFSIVMRLDRSELFELGDESIISIEILMLDDPEFAERMEALSLDGTESITLLISESVPHEAESIT
jgi:hypothetical protein